MQHHIVQGVFEGISWLSLSWDHLTLFVFLTHRVIPYVGIASIISILSKATWLYLKAH
ncbi:MAG: hypothetical protein ACTTH5_03570 [Wolinella sp.]